MTSASGKTQLALQLCLLVQVRPILGGLSGSACYLSTHASMLRYCPQARSALKRPALRPVTQPRDAKLLSRACPLPNNIKTLRIVRLAFSFPFLLHDTTVSIYPCTIRQISIDHYYIRLAQTTHIPDIDILSYIQFTEI